MSTTLRTRSRTWATNRFPTREAAACDNYRDSAAINYSMNHADTETNNRTFKKDLCNLICMVSTFLLSGNQCFVVRLLDTLYLLKNIKLDRLYYDVIYECELLASELLKLDNVQIICMAIIMTHQASCTWVITCTLPNIIHKVTYAKLQL
jgi:hypothetical protein